MKRVFIFIGLKLGEACLAVAGYAVLWGVGRWFIYVVNDEIVFLERHWTDYYIGIPVMGVVTLVVTFVGIMCCVGLYILIKSNWKKAGELANRKRW